MSIAEQTDAIGPGMAGTLMTPEEFDFAEDWEEGYVYELINGVLIVSPPASIEERGPNDFLGQVLRNYADQHPQGKKFLYTATEQTIRTRQNRRRADRVVWVGLGRLPRERRDLPAIAIEFVSPGKRNRIRDYHAKRAEYAEIGIAEYWIIDRFRRRLTVVRNSAGQQTEIVMREDDRYSTPLLPGFELPLSEVFAEADQLHDDSPDDEDDS